jgi:hypothetical protein
MNINLDEPILYRDLIVLYCPKKVGSTSLVSSIRISASDKYNVFHTHDEVIYKSFNETKDLTIEDILRNTGIINKITGKPRKIFIIDIFRSPIERKISEYFEDLGTIHFNHVGDSLYNYPNDKITKRFNDILPYISSTDYYKEIYRVPYPPKFDFDKKYISFSTNNITWIKLRLKDSACWSDILTELLGTEITMIKDYETEEKPIGKFYKEFKKDYKLPFNFFKNIIEDKELNYYYSEEERIEYFSEWKSKLTDFHIPFTKAEYEFYKNISLENQYYDILKHGHYVDDGCLCIECIEKRKTYLKNIKLNIKNKNPIIHDETKTEKFAKIFVKCFYPNGDIMDMIYNVG